MKYIYLLMLLAGCASERELVKTDPIIVAGSSAVFIGALLGVTGN